MKNTKRKRNICKMGSFINWILEKWIFKDVPLDDKLYSRCKEMNIKFRLMVIPLRKDVGDMNKK